MAEQVELSESDFSSDGSSESSFGGAARPNKKVKKATRIPTGDEDEPDISDLESEEDIEEEEQEDEDVAEGVDDDKSQPGSISENMHFPEIDDDEEDDEDDDGYLQKFDEDLHKQVIRDHHPELQSRNYEEIAALCTIIRDDEGNIIDPLHKTLPIVTRYEKARVLGERAKQIESGAPAFVELEETMIDSYTIALREFEAKKIPFIIQRPMTNGACEYWRLRDLEIL